MTKENEMRKSYLFDCGVSVAESNEPDTVVLSLQVNSSIVTSVVISEREFNEICDLRYKLDYATAKGGE